MFEIKYSGLQIDMSLNLHTGVYESNANYLFPDKRDGEVGKRERERHQRERLRDWERTEREKFL